MKQYIVKKAGTPLRMTGKGEDLAWSKATVLEDFSYPWRSDMPPKTRFRALWDQERFYFLFEADDPVIQYKMDRLSRIEPINADRVELFFKANDEMNPYYALEMDALGRVLDTEGRFYRQIDLDWQWPLGHFDLKANVAAGSYTVEGSVTFASLRQLGVYKNDGILQVGIFRAEYVFEEERRIEARWISWVHPASEQPDFHIPSSFGILKLAD